MKGFFSSVAQIVAFHPSAISIVRMVLVLNWIDIQHVLKAGMLIR